jgi:uncharacterized membrane protein YqjE
MDDRHELTDEAPHPSLKKMGSSFVGLLQGHVELFAIELQEEKSRVFSLMVLAGLSLVFALLLLFGLSTLVLIYFWDTHRLGAGIGISLFYLLALLISAGATVNMARQAQAPFRASLDELARTKERFLP